MIFSEKSDVSIVVTSCGRFDLLNKTLCSLNNYNTYPIAKVIITEDSGDEQIREHIPKNWLDHCEIIINQSKLGQIKSIDKAYSKVKTPYIFHCEDDWEFYRNGFIEDSLKILESQNDIITIGLRSYFYDLRVNYPFLSEPIYHQPTSNYFSIVSTNKKQQGFGFNPGLRRLVDYKKLAPYAQFETHKDGAESYLSQSYAENFNMRVVYLSADAVTHIGWGNHVMNDTELKRFNKRKKLRIIRNIFVFCLGTLIGGILF